MAHQTILVVEDNPLNRELVVDLLEGAGYTVLQADEGVGLLERVKAAQPGLILLDLQLPGLDGVTLARQLKADRATREIPVLAMTAYARLEDQERAMEAGCDGYLRKPLDTQGFLQAVARHLGR
jgi:CheY-like chemotaxis protein